MKITKRQLKRIIKEEKARLLRERDPRSFSGPGLPTMKAQILNLAEIVDDEGMAIILNVLEEPSMVNYHDDLETVRDHVAKASPDDLTWIHQELTAEGLFDWYGA